MAEARPIFALDLSNDGITLWHRKGGGWTALGQVVLDAPDIRIQIEDMRVKAGITHSNPVKTVVRIPRSEVMISRLKLGVFEGDAAVSHARKLITELTPYPLNQVVYDLDAKGVGNMAPVAVVARETLQEAEAFAAQYGFNTVYFTTDHSAREFPREPRFYLKVPPKPILPILSRVVAAAAVGLAVGYFGYVKFWTPKPEPVGPVAQLEQPIVAQPVVAQPEVSPQPEVAVIPPEKAPQPEVEPDFSAPQTATLIAPETTAYPNVTIPDIGRTSLSPIDRLARPREQQGTLPPTFQASTTDHKTDALALIEAHRDLPEITLDDDILAKWQQEMALPQVAQNVAGEPLVFAAFTPPNTAYDQMIQSLLAQPVPSYQTPPQDAQIPAAPPPPPPAAVTAEPGTLLPTPEGTLGPENILIYSGRPQVLSRARPDIAPLPDPLAGFRPRPRPVGLTPIDLLLSFTGTPAPSQLPQPEQAGNGPQPPVQQLVTTQTQISLMALPAPVPPEALPQISGPVLSILALADPSLAGIKARPRPANLAPVLPAEPDQTPAEEPAGLRALADPTLAGIKARPRPANLATPEPIVAPIEDTALPLRALADPSLLGKKPRARPAGLKAAPVVDPQSLIARADPTLSRFRAKERPSNLKYIQLTPKVEEKPAENTLQSATRLAVGKSPKPKSRPANFAKLTARSGGSDKATGNTPKTARGTSKPSPSPTTTTVAKAATEKSRFNKRKMSLVGVFGTPSARRALVRMPSGRYVKVKAGDRLSGWKVSAIGESSVRIRKGSKNEILRMP